MSAFTDSVGAGVAGTLGVLFAVAQAASAQGEDWEAQARRYKKLAEDYKELYEIGLKSLSYAEGARDLYLEAADKYERWAIQYAAERDEKMKEVASLRRELAKLQRELAKLQGELTEARRLHKDADQRGADFARMYSELKKETKNLRAQLTSRAARAEIDLEATDKQLAQVQREVDALRRWHAANFALRCALEVQLLRSDPDNPLLQDQDLRERVRRAGEMAVTMLGAEPDPHAPDPFDMAREAGLTFSVPGRPNGVAVLSELALAEVYMRRLLALNLSAERAMEVLQRLQRGEGPATAARELLREMEPNSTLLQPATVQRVEAIAMEEFQRQQQQRRAARGGPTAAWSAAMLGQRQVRERVVEEMEDEIEMEQRDGDA